MNSHNHAMTTATRLTACALLIAVALAIALLATSRAYAQQSCTKVTMIYAEAHNTLYMIDGGGNRLVDVQSGNSLSNRQVNSSIVVWGTPSRIGIEISHTGATKYNYRSNVIQSGDRGYEDYIDGDFNDAVILLTSVICPAGVTPPRRVSTPTRPRTAQANTAPSISSVSADNIAKTTARAVVEIADHDGTELTVNLRYQEKAEAQDWPNAHTDTATSSASPATKSLDNLTPGTEYVLQASLDAAFPAEGTKEHTFTTERPPSISSVSADNIAKTTARAVVEIADHDGTELTVNLRYQEKAEAQDWPNAHTDTATSSASPATKSLDNLTPGTEYVLQASLDAAFPAEGTKEHTFTTERPPSISSVSADNIAKTTARAVVEIADHDGTELTVNLRYQEKAEAQDWPNAHTDTATSSASPATKSLDNLTPGTEYVLQASLDAAFPAEGTKEHTFTTERPPSISSVSADNIAKTTARAVVEIADHDGTELTVNLRYQEKAEAQDWPNAHTDTATSSASPATKSLDNLTPGTEYVLQASLDAAFPAEGTKEHTFTTERPPSISSVSVGDVGQTSAVATVSIADSDGSTQTVKLQYREKDATPVEEWSTRPVQSESSTGATARIDLSGLTANTRYEVQAWLGSDETVKVAVEFRTLPPDPSLSGVSIGSITQTSAVATVSIADSDGSTQTVKLQYREKDATPVEEWSTRPVQSESSTGATARIDLSGLTANTRYEVQAWLGSDETVKVTVEFRTLPDPSLSGVSIGSITQTSAVATVSITDAGSAQKTVYMSFRKFGDTEWSEAGPKTTRGANVAYDLTALEPETTYGVKAHLKADLHTFKHAIFTTLSPEPEPEPSVSGISFGSITQTTAVATVNIADAGSAQKTVRLRYRVNGATTWTTESSQNTGGASKAFSLDGLTAGTTYEVQAWLDLTMPPAGTTTYTFDTLVNPPSISDLSFEDIEQTSATVMVEISDAGTGEKEVFLRFRIQGEDDWTTLPNPATTSGDDASIDLTGLQEQTTYEVAVALSEDFSGTVKKSFTTLPPPSLSGVGIGSITQTSAVATVSIANAGSGQKTALLQHREFGESEWIESESKTTSGASVTFNLTGLDPGTNYEVKAYLSADPDTPRYVVFVTLSPGASVDDSVSVAGVSVGSITQTSAVATVSVAHPGTAQNTVHLRYRKFGESEWVSNATKTAAGASVPFGLSELAPKTKYEVEASLSSDFSDAESATFTTLALDPLISGVRVDNIAQTTATAIVTIANADDASQTVHTRYRATTPQGEWSAAQTTTSITSTAEISLSGLTADTEYEVEVSLTDDFGVSRTATFRTLSSGTPLPDPVVSKISVNNIAQTTATASIGIANADGEEQTVRLRYRTATHGANWGEAQTATSRTGSASIDLTGLAQGARYEVQASLDDSFPTNRTKYTVFTTLRYPSIASVEARNVGRNAATIRATIADSHGEAQTVYIRHRRTSSSAWRTTHQKDSVNDVASLSLGGLSSGTEYIAEASLDDSFPSDETKSVTFTTKDTAEDDTTEDPPKDTSKKRGDGDDGASGRSGTVQAAQAANVPLLGFSPLMLTFTAVEGGDNPSPQTFQVWSRSSGAMTFTLSHSEEWLSQEPLTGRSNGPDNPVTITASVDSSGLASGQYVDVINIDVSSSSEASGQINVTLDVLPPDYVRQFVSRAEGGVVMLPDGTVKIVVPPLAPPKDVDIELMKVDPQAHGAPPEEQERVVVAIDSNTYSPGGDMPEDVAYSPNVELWILLTDGESIACAEGRAKVYEVVSGDWRLVEHRCETDESGNVWIVSEIDRLGAFALVIDDSPVPPAPVAAAVVPAATPTPAATPITVLTVPQGTAVQRTSLPALAPTPTPTQVPTPLPIPSRKTVAASVSFVPTPTPTAVAAPTQSSMPVLQASTVAQSSGGFDWMILAALGVFLLGGAFIVLFLVYRRRRRWRRYVGQYQ